jgi:hypothetical protein
MLSDSNLGLAIGIPIGVATLLFFVCYGCRIRMFGWCLSRTCRVDSCCSRCFIPKRLPMDLRDVMSLPYLSYHAVITHTSLLHIDCQRCSRGIVHHCV